MSGRFLWPSSALHLFDFFPWSLFYLAELRYLFYYLSVLTLQVAICIFLVAQEQRREAHNCEHTLNLRRTALFFFFFQKSLSPSLCLPIIASYSCFKDSSISSIQCISNWTYNCLQTEVWRIQLMFSPYRIYPIRLSLSSRVFWLVEQSQAQTCRRS